MALWDEIDVLVTPTMAQTSIAADGAYGRSALVAVNTAGRFTPFTAIWNVTGQPAVSVPAGLSAEGLPLSVQLVGRLGAEDVLYSLAGQIEQAAPWAQQPSARVMKPLHRLLILLALCVTRRRWPCSASVGQDRVAVQAGGQAGSMHAGAVDDGVLADAQAAPGHASAGGQAARVRLLLRLSDGVRPEDDAGQPAHRPGGEVDRALPGGPLLAVLPRVRADVPPGHGHGAGQRQHRVAGATGQAASTTCGPRSPATSSTTTTAARSC